MSIFINFLAFQMGWFSAVISASIHRPWLGALIMAGVILIHLRTVERAVPELMLVLACGLVGSIWDSVLVSSGWVAYPSGMLLPGLAPYWIVAMWMLFATTLNRSLGWLKGRPLLAILFGAVGGPASYFAGEKLGGIVLVDTTAALTALAIGWGAMMPALLAIAGRYNGVSVEADAEQGWILD